MALNKKEEIKDVKEKDTKEQLLLTEAEFEKRQRAKTREKINRVTRSFGLVAILLLVYVGVFDPLFELSFFGFLFNRSAFTAGWECLSDPNMAGGRIFDDPMIFGSWLPQIGVTALLILVAVLIVYFLTYTIVDIVDLFRGLIESGRDITRDLSGNVKDTMNVKPIEKVEKKKPVKKSLFAGDDVKNDEVPAKEKKERKPRRTESDARDLNGLTGDQLDALLSGKTMEEILKEEEEAKNTLPVEVESDPLKDLFDGK